MMICLKKIIKILLPFIDHNEIIYFYHKKSKFFYNKKLYFFSKYYCYKLYRKTGITIFPDVTLKKNVSFPHPVGIVIGGDTKIGNNCTIYQNVTLGRKDKDVSYYPTIGDNVTIYAGALIAGNVHIGSNSIIGANVIIDFDVPENSIITYSSMIKRINEKESKNG